MLDFDTLILQRPCTDRPSLRLAVQTANPTVNINLQARSANPFAALGISEIRVENMAAGCQTAAGCQNMTAMSPRWAFDLPDVVAFFVSMSSSRAGTKNNYFL